MKNGWEDWRAQCPFYQSETAFSVRCCGWEPGMKHERGDMIDLPGTVSI